jgi:glucose/arabinose dehydrogenase
MRGPCGEIFASRRPTDSAARISDLICPRAAWDNAPFPGEVRSVNASTISPARRAMIRRSVLCTLVWLTACMNSGGGGSAPGGGGPPPAAGFTLALVLFAAGFTDPVGVESAGGADDRLFVIEQAGLIRIVRPNGAVDAAPFLDITGRVRSGDGEDGLLGLAFHPDYATTGYFYVNYTVLVGAQLETRISRFSVTADPDVADPASEEILFTVDQPFPNHNAGDLHFGPDGYLYIPLGDGGSGGDPGNRAQNATLLLGKVTRIDVDSLSGTAADCVGNGTGDYTIPPTNPMADGPGHTCDEIWAVGLRNPWRSSFDRATGGFYLADVGQSDWEEVDVQPAGDPGGENYGWHCYEGNHVYTACPPISHYASPVSEYSHAAGGCTVIGGYVYRGALYPAMAGRYLFTDYCTGTFRDLASDGAGGWTTTVHNELPPTFGYVAFGEDAAAELYVVNIGSGHLYRVEAS